MWNFHVSLVCSLASCPACHLDDDGSCPRCCVNSCDLGGVVFFIHLLVTDSNSRTPSEPQLVASVSRTMLDFCVTDWPPLFVSFAAPHLGWNLAGAIIHPSAASPSGRCRYPSAQLHAGKSSHGTNDLEAEVNEPSDHDGAGGCFKLQGPPPRTEVSLFTQLSVWTGHGWWTHQPCGLSSERWVWPQCVPLIQLPEQRASEIRQEEPVVFGHRRAGVRGAWVRQQEQGPEH